MNARASSRIIVCLLALIVVSGAAGAMIGRRWARAEMARRDNPETWNEAALRTFERPVQPTPAQRPKIEASLAAAIEELKAIRTETILRSSNVIWRLVADVERELTPEQREAFQAMKPRQQDLSTLEVLQVEPTKPPR
jgi:hypothetical protein